MKIKNRGRFIFWTIVFIISAVLLYFIFPLPAIGVGVLFFVGLFVLWQTDLREEALTKGVFILSIGVNIGLFLVSLIVNSLIEDGDWVSSAIAIIVSVVLIGGPTLIVCHVIKSVDKETSTPTAELIRKKLKKGFFLSFWGIDLMFMCIPTMPILIFFDDSAVMDVMLSIGELIVGIICLLVGRTMIGVQSRRINFIKGRARTEEEEWLLSRMSGIENNRDINLMNRIAAETPGLADDILLTKRNAGIISSFFETGKIYTGRKFWRNHFPVIVISAILIAILLINILT